MKKLEILVLIVLSFLVFLSCNPNGSNEALDTTAPMAGDSISFFGTSSTATTANWGAASDDITQVSSLHYKLVKASASSAIDTAAEADAIGGADLVMDWSAAILTKTVTGLTADTSYYFAVLVKDGAGNKGIYTPMQVTTTSAPDTTAPTVGTAISFSGTSGTVTTASWGAASDNVTATASLQYKLVRASASAAIDTVAEADAIAGEGLAMDWSVNDLSQPATGLSSGTTHWFAVLVKDTAGNISLYTPQSVTTTADTTAPTTGTAVSFSGTSATATTVSWGPATDDTTATNSLQYKLVWSSSSPFIDTVAEANAATITNGGTAMDWTANTLTKGVTSLSASTIYFFAVLVRDAAGNISLFAPQSVTTSAAPDTTAPTVGSPISFSGTSSTATTVNWGAASDNATPQSNLQYKLVRASASTSIDTVAEVNAISGSALVMDWTAGTTSWTATSLTASTTYFFAVLVMDGAGNTSLSSPQSVTTSALPDTTAPTRGTPISFSGTASTVTTVNWGAGTDDVTPQANLQYRLVKASALASIDTVAEVNAISGANLLMDWIANATSSTVTGLTAATTYYFAVAVRDATGNSSLYSPQSVTTSSVANLSFDLNTNPGWTTSGDWQWGTVTNVGPIGAVCYGTNISGPYSDNMTFATNYVASPALNFTPYPAATGFKMTFQAYFDLDCGYDFATIQYSTNGITFATIPAAYVSGYTYSSGMSEPDVWSPNPFMPGDTPEWRSVVIDLGGLGLNGQGPVYFRWVLSSDESITGPGFYIDNITIGY